jgi:hypothetical protein
VDKSPLQRGLQAAVYGTTGITCFNEGPWAVMQMPQLMTVCWFFCEKQVTNHSLYFLLRML